MTVLRTSVDPTSPEYQANREALLAQLEAVTDEQAKAVAGGGPKYVDRHHARGKMTARERIETAHRRGLPVPGAVGRWPGGAATSGRRQCGDRDRGGRRGRVC
jgi:hypothetical protein